MASPATVSRCGMVYQEPTALGLGPLVPAWMARLPEPFPPEYKEKLYKYIRAS